MKKCFYENENRSLTPAYYDGLAKNGTAYLFTIHAKQYTIHPMVIIAQRSNNITILRHNDLIGIGQ